MHEVCDGAGTHSLSAYVCLYNKHLIIEADVSAHCRLCLGSDRNLEFGVGYSDGTLGLGEGYMWLEPYRCHLSFPSQITNIYSLN